MHLFNFYTDEVGNPAPPRGYTGRAGEVQAKKRPEIGGSWTVVGNFPGSRKLALVVALTAAVVLPGVGLFIVMHRQPAAIPSRIGDSLVEVTVWKLRTPEASDDPAARIESRNGAEQWTPIRVGADTPLAVGQKVPVSFETARAGYLYVIDREQNADGTFGSRSLILPTLLTHAGNNQVTAGRFIEIPALDDNPPYFTMQANRGDQVAEVLTVIIAPNPLAELKIGPKPLPVSPDQVRAWEQQWGVHVQRLEAVGEAGKAYTKAEKEASDEIAAPFPAWPASAWR